MNAWIARIKNGWLRGNRVAQKITNMLFALNFIDYEHYE